MTEYELENKNYHDTTSRQKYMGSSQFKDFLKCEVMALAKINGEYEEESSKALLFGSYVDAYFSNELDDFKNDHPELFTKNGELKADYKLADDVIKAIEEDEGMSNALNGEKQVIMVGTIAGVPFKIKMDAYHKDKAIVDQKVMASLDEKYWIKNEEGRNEQVDFIRAFRYDLQGAIYQEIEKQASGREEKLPFIIAATSKQKYPAKKLIEIDQDTLDLALEEVKEKAPRFQRIKEGLEPPKGCGKCEMCRKLQTKTKVITYNKYKNELEEE